jgi:hypothetical protein
MDTVDSVDTLGNLKGKTAIIVSTPYYSNWTPVDTSFIFLISPGASAEGECILVSTSIYR